MRFNPPPNWPTPPEGWHPEPGWKPDPAWGPAPEGWQVWVDDGAPSAPEPLVVPAGRKNWFLRHKILTAVGALLLLGILSSALGGAGGGDPAPPAAAGKPTSSPTANSSTSITTTEATPSSSAEAAPESKTTGAVPTATPRAQPYRAVTSREFKKIFKDPDAHKGERVIVWAEITQFDAATGDAHFLANAGHSKQRPTDGFVDFSDSAIFDGDAAMFSELVQNDLVEVRATVVGSFSYDTQIGGRTTVPQFKVSKIKQYGSTDS
jgi:hypothetical protein